MKTQQRKLTLSKRKTVTQQMREQLTKPYMVWGFSYQRTRDAILVK